MWLGIDRMCETGWIMGSRVLNARHVTAEQGRMNAFDRSECNGLRSEYVVKMQESQHVEGR